VTLFLEEARLAARVRHLNVVSTRRARTASPSASCTATCRRRTSSSGSTVLPACSISGWPRRRGVSRRPRRGVRVCGRMLRRARRPRRRRLLRPLGVAARGVVVAGGAGVAAVLTGVADGVHEAGAVVVRRRLIRVGADVPSSFADARAGGVRHIGPEEVTDVCVVRRRLSLGRAIALRVGWAAGVAEIDQQRAVTDQDDARRDGGAGMNPGGRSRHRVWKTTDDGQANLPCSPPGPGVAVARGAQANRRTRAASRPRLAAGGGRAGGTVPA